MILPLDPCCGLRSGSRPAGPAGGADDLCQLIDLEVFAMPPVQVNSCPIR